MRQHTTNEQKEKLIELGYPKPQTLLDMLDPYIGDFSYSIGELMSFLVNPVVEGVPDAWIVNYDSGIKLLPPFVEQELVDALFNACVHQKKKKVYE